MRVEVGRRLHADVAIQNQPRQRDGVRNLVVIRLWGVGHRNPAPRHEVLHDHFLDVAVLTVQVSNHKQALHALASCLADADQDPGGERDL